MQTLTTEAAGRKLQRRLEKTTGALKEAWVSVVHDDDGPPIATYEDWTTSRSSGGHTEGLLDARPFPTGAIILRLKADLAAVRGPDEATGRTAFLADHLDPRFPSALAHRIAKLDDGTPRRTLIGIRAPQGTGKTHLLTATLEPYEKVVVVSNRRRLITQMAGRLNVADYQEHESSRWKQKRLAICLNSVRREPARTHATDILVVDEAVGTLVDLANGDHVRGNDPELRGQVFEGLEELTQQAGVTVLSDANLDLTTLAQYAGLFGFDRIVHVEYEEEGTYRGAATIMPRGDAERAALLAVESAYVHPSADGQWGTAPIIQCTSKGAIKVLAKTIRTLFPNMPVTEITSDTKNEQAVRSPTAPPGVVLASPSVDAGVDWHLLQGAPARPVFFLDSRAEVGVSQVVQMVNRCRWVKTLVVGTLQSSWTKAGPDGGSTLKEAPSEPEMEALVMERAFDIEAMLRDNCQGLARFGKWARRDMSRARQLATEMLGTYEHLSTHALERTSAFLSAMVQIQSPKNGYRGALIRAALEQDGYSIKERAGEFDSDAVEACEEEPRRQFELEIQNTLRHQRHTKAIEGLLDDSRRVSIKLDVYAELQAQREPTNWDIHQMTVRKTQDQMGVSDAEREILAEVLIVPLLEKRIATEMAHVEGRTAEVDNPLSEECAHFLEEMLTPLAVFFQHTTEQAGKRNPYSLATPDRVVRKPRKQRKRDVATNAVFDLSPAALEHLDSELRLLGYAGRADGEAPRIRPRLKEVDRVFSQDLGAGWKASAAGGVLHMAEVPMPGSPGEVAPLGYVLISGEHIGERWVRKHLLPHLKNVAEGLPYKMKQAWLDIESIWSARRAPGTRRPPTRWRREVINLISWLFGVPDSTVVQHRTYPRIDGQAREVEYSFTLPAGTLWALDRLMARESVCRWQTDPDRWAKMRQNWVNTGDEYTLGWEDLIVSGESLSESWFEEVEGLYEIVKRGKKTLLHARFGSPRQIVRGILSSARARQYLERWRLVFGCVPEGHLWRVEGLKEVQAGLRKLVLKAAKEIEEIAEDAPSDDFDSEILNAIDEKATEAVMRGIDKLDILPWDEGIDVPQEVRDYSPDHGDELPATKTGNPRDICRIFVEDQQWYARAGSGGYPGWLTGKTLRPLKKSPLTPAGLGIRLPREGSLYKDVVNKLVRRLPGGLSDHDPRTMTHSGMHTDYALFAASALSEVVLDEAMEQAYGDIATWLCDGAPMDSVPEITGGGLRYVQHLYTKEQDRIAQEKEIALIPAIKGKWRAFPMNEVPVYVDPDVYDQAAVAKHASDKSEELHAEAAAKHARSGTEVTAKEEAEIRDEVRKRMQLCSTYQKAAKAVERAHDFGDPKPSPIPMQTLTGRTTSNTGYSGQRAWSIGSAIPGIIRAAFTPAEEDEVWVGVDVQACVPTLLLHFLGQRLKKGEDPYAHPLWAFPENKLTRSQRKYLLLKNAFGQTQGRLREALNHRAKKRNRVSAAEVATWVEHMEGLVDGIPAFRKLRRKLVRADKKGRRWVTFDIAGFECTVPLKKDKAGRNTRGRALSLLLFGLESLAISLATALLAFRHETLVPVGLYDELLITTKAHNAQAMATNLIQCVVDGFALLGCHGVVVKAGWGRHWGDADTRRLSGRGRKGKPARIKKAEAMQGAT